MDVRRYIFITAIFATLPGNLSATSLNPFTGDNAPVCETVSQYPDANRDPAQSMQICRSPLQPSGIIEFRDNRLTDPVTNRERVSSNAEDIAFLPAMSGAVSYQAPKTSGIKFRYTPCRFGAVMIYEYPMRDARGAKYEYELLDLRPSASMLIERGVTDILPDDAYNAKAASVLTATAELSPSTPITYCENLGGY